MNIEPMFRPKMRKSIWCEGCGLGNLQKIFTTVLVTHVAEKLKLDAAKPKDLEQIKNNIALVSGIGCTSRMPGHIDVNTIHTTHGRSLGFATGVKMARPDLTVALVAGDGDIFAIGGNHFIHAARRNPDLTLIVYDNESYGMTGSQHSPTSPLGEISASAPFGTFEPPFDIVSLAIGAGASFVAQAAVTTSQLHQEQLEELITAAVNHKGFSIVNVRGTCHTGWGAKNKRGEPFFYREYIEQQAIPVEEWRKLSPDRKAGRIPLGIIHQSDRLDLQRSATYLAAVDRSKKQYETEEVEPAEKRVIDPMTDYVRTTIRFAGSGGQGVISAGEIAMKAAIKSGRNGVFTKNYGPEARGGEAFSDLIVSEGDIHFPQSEKIDVLLALNQETFDKFRSQVAPNGKIIVNSTSVVDTHGDARVVASPIGDLHSREVQPPKRELGINVTALAVLFGYLDLLPRKALIDSVMNGVGKKNPALNSRALEVGFKEAARLLA
jgi:2-oxoglutarate ferredoxin oxidoreductase subunit beta